MYNKLVWLVKQSNRAFLHFDERYERTYMECVLHSHDYTESLCFIWSNGILFWIECVFKKVKKYEASNLKKVEHVLDTWNANFYSKRCEHLIKNPLYYHNLHKCNYIELLTSQTLTRRYFPVCSEINYETSRDNFDHRKEQVQRENCIERL